MKIRKKFLLNQNNSKIKKSESKIIDEKPKIDIKPSVEKWKKHIQHLYSLPDLKIESPKIASMGDL